MVGGQLHNEGSRLTGEHPGLLQHNAGHDDGGHADEVSGGSNPCAAAKQSARDHGDEGNLRAAGDEGGGHNGHPAVTLVFNGTGRHNAGNAAAGADQHGDKGLTGQAEFPEDTVENECDTGHVAAGFQNGQQQEQHQHLRHEAQNRADTGHDAIQNQAAEPFSRISLLQQVANENRDTGHPNAVVCGVGFFAFQRFKRFFIVSQRSGLLGDLQSLLILDFVGEVAGGSGAVLFHVGVVAVYDQGRLVICISVFVVIGGADAEQVPAVAEQAVVCPVGSSSAHADHGDVVNKEHDNCEDGQAQPAVGHDLIDLIGGGQLTGGVLLVAALDDLADVDVTLVGNDALGVVVQLLLGSFDVGLDVRHGLLGQTQLLHHLVVTLEDLDGVPTLLLLGQAVNGGFLDVGNGVLHRAGEGVHGNGLAVLCGVDRSFGSGHNAVALQGGDLDDLAAQRLRQLVDIDLVAVLADDIHHVDGDDHGDAQLGQLGG